MEQLFTLEQIAAIQTEAELELEKYLGGLVIDGEATEISIVTISKDKQLIFVEGNEHSGYNHLKDRHNYFSYKNYWTLNDGKEYRLDNPSKFHPRMMPIVDYVKIADTIFCEENKNITKNHKPDLFDKYTGYYTYSENDPEKYHLLTYKDTKIVHTLFPDKKKHNKKIKCRFGKGIVSTKLKFPDAINDMLVPYEDKNGQTAYSILFRKYYSEKIERLIIQKHNEDAEVCEQYVIAYKDFDDFVKFEREDMNSLQYGDLTDLEELINQIDDQTKNNCS